MFLGTNLQKRRQIISRLFVFYSWFVAIFVLSTISNAERLPIKTYTVADGLLRDFVTRIRQDSRGFLWFCTVEGISRFDGYNFTNFRTDDGLPERHIYDFWETQTGTIWIATGDGLAKLNPKGIRNSQENPLFTIFLPDNPKAKVMSVLFEDKDGTVWVGTSDGLYHLNATDEGFAFENVLIGKPPFDSLPITSIIQDRRGVLWVGTESGLFRILSSGQIEHYTAAEGLPNNYISSLLEDVNGQIWVGFRDSVNGGLARLVDEPASNRSIAERIYTKKDGLPSDWVPDLFQSSDGKLWVATTKGLCLWQGDSGNSVCKTYTARNDLCDYDIWSVTEDKDGNLWTGSRCGAKKMARYGFTTYDEADSLSDSSVNSIFENPSGEFFASSLSRGLTISRFDGNKFLTVKPNLPTQVKDFSWGWKQTVWQDSAGAWWIPTGEGLFRFSDVKDFAALSQAASEEVKTGAKSKNIFRLFEDLHGDVWIAVLGNPSELLRWERAADVWHNYTETLGFSKKLLGGTVFLEDKSGNLWIATGSDAGESGLIRYRDGKFRVFKEEDNAPPGWTRDLFLDHAGRLWFANTTWGLLRLDDTNSDVLNFVRYTTAEGLSSNGVYCVTEDKFGRIYVGTGRGLDRVYPETGQIENFTTADGLPNSDVEVAYRDRQNALWFATTDGLARFQPEPARTRKPPTVLITGLRVGGESQAVSILGETEISELDLNSDQTQVSVDFLGLGATLGEKLRYEFHITGEDWVQTNERTLNFANLSSGNYRFEIRAVSADRIISQPAVLSFKIAAPFWQQWWFIVLMSLLVGFVIYGIYRNRLTRLLEIERTRTRIATDLHDDIGTNLSKISLLSGIVSMQLQNENLQNKQMLNSIAEISRESVNSMSDIVWAINPNRDSVLEMSRRMREFAEEIFVEKDVRVNFNESEESKQLKLNMNTRRELYLIFKEAVNNAMRHSDCTEINIDFRIADGNIFLELTDNGRGFDVLQHCDGNGLANMKNRAEKIGGKFEVSSKSGNGVKITVFAPY